MSHRRIKQGPRLPQPILWWHVVLPVCGVLLLVVLTYFISNWIHSFPPGYETRTAKIMSLRRVVDRTMDTGRGGVILYRLEAQVQYETNGNVVVRWLRASEPLPEDSLVLKLAGHPTTCLVYWLPSRPENARCSLK